MRFLLLTILIALPFLANARPKAEKVSENWTCWTAASREYGIPVDLLKGIAKQESGFNPYATGKNTNGSYDLGLMQINTFWLKKGGVLHRHNVNADKLLNDPCLNLYVGAWVLRNNIKQYGYNWKAVGAYNARTEWKRVKYANSVWKHVKTIENTKVGYN